jgi:hypothetical protein
MPAAQSESREAAIALNWQTACCGIGSCPRFLVGCVALGQMPIVLAPECKLRFLEPEEMFSNQKKIAPFSTKENYFYDYLTR